MSNLSHFGAVFRHLAHCSFTHQPKERRIKKLALDFTDNAMDLYGANLSPTAPKLDCDLL